MWENNLVPCFERNGFQFWGKTNNDERKLVHNVVGNHELYCFSRQNLAQKLFSKSKRHYYSFTPHPSFRVIILDSYDISTLNGDPEETSEAFSFVEKKNPNDIRANVDWFVGLEGVERRWVPFNGMLGELQLQWLEGKWFLFPLIPFLNCPHPYVTEELGIAKKEGQKVIILSHCHLGEGVASPASLLWNYDKLSSCLRRENGVVAVLVGHDHKFFFSFFHPFSLLSLLSNPLKQPRADHPTTTRHGYLQDNSGTHHWSVPAILESARGAHAVLRVYSDRICVQGCGEVSSFVMEIH